MRQLRARRPNLATDSAPCMRVESHIWPIRPPSSWGPLIVLVTCNSDSLHQCCHAQQASVPCCMRKCATRLCIQHSSLHTTATLPPPVSPCAAACPCLQGPILDSRFGLQSDPWICAGSVLIRALWQVSWRDVRVRRPLHRRCCWSLLQRSLRLGVCGQEDWLGQVAGGCWVRGVCARRRRKRACVWRAGVALEGAEKGALQACAVGGWRERFRAGGHVGERWRCSLRPYSPRGCADW